MRPPIGKGHRVKWWHVHVSLGTVLVAIALASIALTGPAAWRYYHGVKLNKQGQHALGAVQKSPELGHGAIVAETPPSATIKKLNRQAAIQENVKYPTLAAPEPVVKNCWVRNYSSRNGALPTLFIVHDTESPNVSGRGPPGLQDDYAICAWFNNPSAQASSNYVTDADGNTLHLVPDTAKAWTQAGFNSWSVSDEMIGYASQKTWPFAQLYAVAKIAAHVMTLNHIPIQPAIVNGNNCRVIRPGIAEHRDLGVCGGGHHDAGLNFPMARFVTLVKSFTHPVVKTRVQRRAIARKAVLKLRAAGQSWATIKTTAAFHTYVALGGH